MFISYVAWFTICIQIFKQSQTLRYAYRPFLALFAHNLSLCLLLQETRKIQIVHKVKQCRNRRSFKFHNVDGRQTLFLFRGNEIEVKIGQQINIKHHLTRLLNVNKIVKKICFNTHLRLQFAPTHVHSSFNDSFRFFLFFYLKFLCPSSFHHS